MQNLDIQMGDMDLSNKVLVVEDSRAFRRHLERQLILAGFELHLAASVEETVNILKENNDYLCAVLDYCLPDGEDGEIIDIVLQEEITSIVFTAQFSPVIRDAMLKKGVFDYVLKDSPSSVLYLISMLQRLKANGKHTVLVVDDSVTARGAINTLLKKQNLKTLQAADGEEALQLLSCNPEVSLIITDNHMPNRTGTSMLREVRNRYNHSQFMIIGMSSCDDSTMTAQFLKAGANDFLTKPFNQEEFYCRVNNVLNYKDTNTELCKIANEDVLTGLWNRRYFFEHCGNILPEYKTLSLAMLDIDFFKKINDNYGHDAGDVVLFIVSQIIKEYFPTGLVARIGGEEFCIQQTCDFESFISTLEKLRKGIQEKVISYLDQEISVTMSLGAVCGNLHINQLMKQADINLYEAKNGGRNRLVHTLAGDSVADVIIPNSVVRAESR